MKHPTWKVAAVMAAGGLCLSGCGPSQVVRQRGWLGGTFVEASGSIFARDYQVEPGGSVKALPSGIRQGRALVVTGLEDGAPLARAGLKTGDLLTGIAGKPVCSEGSLRSLVDGMKPGSTVNVTTWRNGATSETPVTVGMESYKRIGYLKLGFGLGTTLKLIPDPDFNLFNLIRVQGQGRRNGMDAPEYRYLSAAKPGSAEIKNRLWDAWLVVIGVGRYDVILSQSVTGGASD